MNNKDASGEDCGHARRREDVEDKEILSEILHCPKCGFDGPLTIEIKSLPAA